MRRLLPTGMVLCILVSVAACAETDGEATATTVAPTTTTTSPTTTTIEAAPLAAIPPDAELVSGTAICDVLVGEGFAPDGTPGSDIFLCELDMSDPRVSGTQRDDRWRIVVEERAAFAWVFEESTITNEDGTWRGAIQAADDGNPCGEAHYVGEDAYEGLEFHYYFCDKDGTPMFRGWISAGE